MSKSTSYAIQTAAAAVIFLMVVSGFSGLGEADDVGRPSETSGPGFENLMERMVKEDGASAEEVKAAYDAPFPARVTMGGPRSFPGLVNTLGGATRSAWEGLRSFYKPFLTIWAGNDPIILGRPETQQKLIDEIPGANGRPHIRLPKAGHFLQEDQGERIAELIVDFMRKT